MANEEEKAEDKVVVDVDVDDNDERRRVVVLVVTPQLLSRKRSHHALRSQLGSVLSWEDTSLAWLRESIDRIGQQQEPKGR